MTSRVLGAGLLLLLAVALDAAVSPHLVLLGAAPDLVLTAVLLIAVTSGRFAGSAAGLFAGLCLDVLHGRQIGLFALALGAAGALAAEVARRVYPTRAAVRFLIAAAATVVEQVAVLALYRLLGGRVAVAAAGLILVRQAVYDGLLLAVLYPPFLKLRGPTQPTAEMRPWRPLTRRIR